MRHRSSQAIKSPYEQDISRLQCCKTRIKSRTVCFCSSPSEEQLERYFYLDDADRALIRKRRGDHNKLGFAVQLGTVRFLSTFLSDPTDIPKNVAVYIGLQLGINNLSALNRYGIGETRWDHADEIKKYYGYKDFTDRVESFAFVRWLYNRSALSNERPCILFDLATSRLVERKVLLPGTPGGKTDFQSA